MRHFILTATAQILQSAASFLATLALANALTPSEFGIYAAVLSVWMIVLSASRAVLGEQLIAGGTAVDGYRDFTMLWAGAGIAVTSLLMILVGDGEVLIAGLYCALFVLSDALRYEQFAMTPTARRLHLVNVVDLLRTGVAATGFALALVPGAEAFTLAAVVLSASIWPVVALRNLHRLRVARAVSFVRRLGKFEAAISAQFLLGTGLAQAIPFLALLAFGPAAFGYLKLAQSLVGPVALVGTAAAPGLVKLVGGTERRKQVRVALVALVIAAIGALAIAGGWGWLTLTIGPAITPRDSWDLVAQLVVPCSVATALVLLGQPGSALLRARRYASVAIGGQTVGVLITLVLALLALDASLAHFAWAIASGAGCTVAATYLLLLRRARAEDAGR